MTDETAVIYEERSTPHQKRVHKNDDYYNYSYPSTWEPSRGEATPSPGHPRDNAVKTMSEPRHHPRSFVSVARPEWERDRKSLATHYGISEDTVIVKRSNSDIGETTSDEDENDDAANKYDGCGRKQNRFNNTQDQILVGKWVALWKELQSGDSRRYWKIIQDEVNKAGSHKSVTQIKKKILALKKRYKDVKLHNQSGRPRMTCKFYEEIDSVLGVAVDTKSAIPLPLSPIITTNEKRDENRMIENNNGHANVVHRRPEYIDSRLTTDEIDYENSYNNCRRDENGYHQREREDENEREYRNRRKRGKFDATIAINETLIEMQERQERFVERFFNKITEIEERAEERSNQFLLKLIDAIKK